MADIGFAVVGGGVVGRAIALHLSRKSDKEIAVLEKCAHDAVENQSTRNSGVIHAGIYYKKSIRPHKAKLCVEGGRMLYDFCQEHGVHHKRCGKLVVATNEMEEGYLDDVLETATENEVPGVTMISGDEARAMEPNVTATRALYAPSSGVIDAVGYLKKLREIGGCYDLFGTRVLDIRKVSEGFELRTQQGSKIETFTAETVINAAGLYGDEVAAMINSESPYRVMPVRGEAAKFYGTRRSELQMNGMNVYPAPYGFYKSTGQRAVVPYAEFKRLLAAGDIIDTVGVHITPTLDEDGEISKTITVCPVITTGIEKEDYGTNLRSPEYYWERVKNYFPGLRVEDLELHQAGIQARFSNALDWIIEPDPQYERFINVLGVDSPGMTASLAIARHVVDDLLGE